MSNEANQIGDQSTIHEAAHVVACVDGDIRIVDVSLEPFGFHGGITRYEPPASTWMRWQRDYPDRTWIDLLITHVRMVLAGPVADKVFGVAKARRQRRWPKEHVTDDREINRLLVTLQKLGHALNLEQLESEARELVVRRRDDIQRIATELKRRRSLTARMVARIIREGANFKPRGGYVPPHWSHGKRPGLYHP